MGRDVSRRRGFAARVAFLALSLTACGGGAVQPPEDAALADGGTPQDGSVSLADAGAGGDVGAGMDATVPSDAGDASAADDGGGAYTDAAAPFRLVGVTPADGATDVALAVTPVLTFTADVDASSVGSGSVTLAADGGGEVPVRLTVAGPTITVTPLAPLVRGTWYVLTVLPGVLSVDGVATTDGLVVGFRLRDGLHALGGSVVGLTAPVELDDVNGERVRVYADGTFVFPTLRAEGEAYDVRVASRVPGLVCRVDAGAGVVPAGPVTGIVVSCGPTHARFAYAVAGQDHVVAMYLVDGDTGVLRPNGQVRTSLQAGRIEVAPDGASAYVPTLFGVEQYGIDARGVLQALASGTLARSSARSVAVHPNGRYAYVASSAGLETFARASDGSLVATGIPPASITDSVTELLVHPSGRYLYALGSNTLTAFLVELDGGLVPVGGPSIPAPFGATRVAVHPDGRSVYVTDPTGGRILGFGVGVGGALTALAASPFSAGTPRGRLAFDRAGTRAYVADVGGAGAIRSFAVAADGTLTPSGSPLGEPSVEALTAPRDGSFLYTVRPSQRTHARLAIAADGTLAPVSPHPAYVRTAGAPSDLVFAEGLSPARIAPRGVYVRQTASALYFSADDTGALTLVDTEPTGGFANLGVPETHARILLHPTGPYAYSANANSANGPNVVRFAVEPDAGLRLVETLPIPGNGVAMAPVLRPDGRFLYVGKRTGSVGDAVIAAFEIGSDGSAVYRASYAPPVLTPAVSDLYDLAVAPAGTEVYALYRQVGSTFLTLCGFRVDFDTGALTPFDFSASARCMAVSDQTDRAIAIAPLGLQLYANFREAFFVLPSGSLAPAPAPAQPTGLGALAVLTVDVRFVHVAWAESASAPSGVVGYDVNAFGVTVPLVPSYVVAQPAVNGVYATPWNQLVGRTSTGLTGFSVAADGSLSQASWTARVPEIAWEVTPTHHVR